MLRRGSLTPHDSSDPRVGTLRGSQLLDREEHRVALGIANVWLPVGDTDRAVQFYEGTLGLSLAKRDGDWAEVETDGLRIGLNGREPEGAGADGGPVVTF